MSYKPKYTFTLYKSTNMQNMLTSAVKLRTEVLVDKFKSLGISEYNYTPDEAVVELDLELELVEQLIEDYVIQIVKSNMTFLEYLKELKSAQENGKDLDYTNLRDLAHKNLGVARNLRIYSAEKLLDRIMKEDDLDDIFLCLEALFSCVTILRPKEAFNTLRLIKVKNSF